MSLASFGAAARADARGGPRRSRPSPLRCALLLFWSAAGCDGSEPAGHQDAARLDRQQFVQVYVELRRAELELGGDVPAFEARRSEILARHGTTAEAVLEFVERHAHDPRLFTEIWDSIQVRLANPALEADRGPSPVPPP